MKKNILKQQILLGALVLLTFSCSKEKELNSIEEAEIAKEIVDEGAIERNAFLKDITLLLGKAMQDAKVQDELLSNMHDVDMYGELVSMSYMLGNDKMISKSEKNYLTKKGASVAKNSSLFKEAITNELFSGNDSYKGIFDKYQIQPITAKSSKTAKDLTANQLLELLANEELHLYYPYEVSGKTSRIENELDMLITYSPEGYTESNEVYRVVNTSNNSQLQSVGYQDDDYLYDNSVLVIGYMDDCDIQGRPCDFDEVYPIFAEDPNLPPPFTGGPKLLPYNVNPEDIKEEDILSTRMMQFGTKDSGWGGFGATHLKLEVKRGSLDGNPTVVNGKVSSGAKVFDFFKTRYRMKGDRNGWWHDYSAVFDEDWNMTEAEQMIAIFTNHHLSSKVSADLTAKVGAEVKDGKIVPKVEASIGYSVKVEVGASNFRTKFAVSRKLALTTIVGSNDFYSETRSLNGTEWNVKRSTDKKFFYFFNHYYTKLH